MDPHPSHEPRSDGRQDDLESERPRSSDRVWLEVALLDDGAPAGLDPPHAEHRAGTTVLLVAPDAELRAYLRACLAPLQPRVLEAPDLAAAVEAARGEAPDLLILDLVGPQAVPEERIAEWPAIAALTGVPRLLLSDEPLSPARTRRADGSVRAVIVKPFNAQRLREEVVRCLGRRAGASPASGETL